MEAIQFNRETLVAIYGNCNAEGRKAIRGQLGEKLPEILPVTDRVKTFRDAVEELGEDHEAVKAYNAMEWYLRDTMPDIKAYLQLRVITAALNEGWEPKFTTDEYRWYPWFRLYTESEVNELDEEDRASLVLWGGFASHGSSAGLAYADSLYAFSASGSVYGARLALKSEELAIYAAKQFISIYADFCFISKGKESK